MDHCTFVVRIAKAHSTALRERLGNEERREAINEGLKGDSSEVPNVFKWNTVQEYETVTGSARQGSMKEIGTAALPTPRSCGVFRSILPAPCRTLSPVVLLGGRTSPNELARTRRLRTSALTLIITPKGQTSVYSLDRI